MSRMFEISADSYGAKRMSPADRAMSHRQNGGLQRYRLARMKQDVKGEFTRWRKGEIVKAKGARGWDGEYVIEKVKPAFPFLPLLSQCVGIPRRVLEFVK